MQMNNKKQQNGSIMTWLAIFMMIGFWVWFFNFAPLVQYQQKIKHILDEVQLPKIGVGTDVADKMPKQMAFPTDEAIEVCDATAPKSGKHFLLSKESHANKGHARFFAANEHAYPVLITFLEANSDLPFGAVYLLPNQSNQVHLPVGNYHLSVQSGVDWCNASRGFNDGAYIDANRLVQIKANQVVNMRMLPFGESAADVMLSFTNSLGLLPDGKQIQGTGSLIMQRVVGGHYAVKGSINQLPVNFLLDTGATHVLVPEAFAKRASITECRPYLSSTANGVVKGCIATIDELTIGQFTIKNIEVAYHKGLPNDTFLLGMSVISLFKMEHHGDVMKLTR